MDILLAIYGRDLRLAIDLFLREEPDINVISVVSETESLLALFKTTHPQIVLLDWDLPGRAIPEIVQKIHTAADPPKIVVLSNSENERDIALEAGADAFVVKGEPPQQLVAAIREISLPKNQEKTKENNNDQ